jgi:ATP-binding cassette subfamily B protein
MIQNKKITFFQLLWKYVKQFKIAFFFIFSLYSLLAIERVYFPYLTGEIIDSLTKLGENRENFWIVVKNPVLIIIFTIIGMDLLFRVQEFLTEYYIPRFKAKIREEVFEYTMNHSNRFFTTNHAGSISGKINDLTDTSISILMKMICVFVPVVSTVIISIFTVLFINQKAGLIFTLWMVVHFLIVIFTTKFVEKHWGNWSEANNVLRGKIVDSINNISNVRLFSMFKNELSYCKKYQDEEIKLSFKAGFAGIIVRTVLSFVSISGLTGILYFLLIGWKNSEITTGNIAAILAISINSVLLMWWMAYESLFFFMELGKAKQAMFLLNEPHEIQDIENAKNLVLNKNGSEIKFLNVSFGYNDKKFFKNINLTIPHGQKIGLVGFSGAGKTTFANLILREFNLSDGQILIDDQDISKITLRSLHENISYIAQDSQLFHRTIMENIRFAKPNAIDEEIIEASKKACCHDFIMKNENGYETLVGERGAKLSGGQKQRISIARAMLKNAPIVILDEATSALDSITEQKIKDAINKLIVNKTTIIIAHRLSTLKDVDRILVFDDGKIIEDGNHNQLIKIKNGYYKKLWEAQNDLYDMGED